MKVIRAYMDTYCENKKIVYFLYDSDVNMIMVNRIISDMANEFFEENEYLGGYDYMNGWKSKEDEDNYYNHCYYDWEEITKDEMIKEIDAEYEDVAEAEIHDYRIKEKE